MAGEVTDGGKKAGSAGGVPRVGDVVAGKFVVEGVLGSGGMGTVLAARHVTLGQRVAIKCLLPSAASDLDAVARFVREARAAVNLHSEHVVRVMDVGSLDDGLPYFVMERLTGTDLGVLLVKRRVLPIEEAVDYTLQAMEAIAEAHAFGLVHRDLKPSNLFLTARPDGSAFVKVLDFGISKTLGASDAPSLTTTSAVVGSPAYMSPEQMRSPKNVDARADVWALGVLLYELVSGRTPFEGETVMGVCSKIAADPPMPLREVLPGVSPPFEAVVMRCLEKDRDKRLQSVAQLAALLRPFAPSEAVVAVDRIQRIGPTSGPRQAEEHPSIIPGGGVHSTTGVSETVASWDATKGRGRRSSAWVIGFAVTGLAAVGAAAFVRRAQHPSARAEADSVSRAPASATVTPPVTSIGPVAATAPSDAVAAAAPAPATSRGVAVSAKPARVAAPRPARAVPSAQATPLPSAGSTPAPAPTSGDDVLIERK